MADVLQFAQGLILIESLKGNLCIEWLSHPSKRMPDVRNLPRAGQTGTREPPAGSINMWDAVHGI